jgi:hypothetical protein
MPGPSGFATRIRRPVVLTVLHGAQYQLGRIGAGSCGAVFVYVAMRWVVFQR